MALVTAPLLETTLLTAREVRPGQHQESEIQTMGQQRQLMDLRWHLPQDLESIGN